MRNRAGLDLTEPEAELVSVYESLRRMLDERRGELAPYQERNALKALSCLWQVVNGLDMEPDQLYHLGI